MGQTTRSPTPHPPALGLVGQEGEKWGAEPSPGRRERLGGGVFKMWLYFSLPYSDYISN